MDEYLWPARNVAELLRSPVERRKLAAAGPDDAQAWSAPALMERVVDLYTNLRPAQPAGDTAAVPASSG